jgi:aryl-alcohol dehydrogenase-like predicted oxidoreductase
VGLLALNLQYCMRERRIASTILGASTPSEIEADVAAACEPVPESVWDELRGEFGL